MRLPTCFPRRSLPRPRTLSGALAFAAALHALPIAATAAGSSSAPFYYSDGSSVRLDPSSRYVAVRLGEPSAEATKRNLMDRLGDSLRRDLDGVGLTLFTLADRRSEAEMDDLLRDLRLRPEVTLVAPVFEAPGALMIVTDRFIARLRPDVPLEEVAELAERFDVELVRRARWDERTFLLRTRTGDALEAANAYHEDPRVELAHPDFVRVMEREVPRLRLPESRVVFGPDGRSLPSTTDIPEGAEGYRIVEPASFDRPPRADDRPVSPPLAPVERRIIKRERFESGFPNAWQLSGSPRWNDVSTKSYSGAWSGYAGSTPPGSYPKNANTWMVYGPFSLADAEDARADLQAWVRTATGDVLFLGASTNGSSFQGFAITGNWATAVGGAGWMNISFDLRRDAGLDLTGRPSIWFAIALIADGNGQTGQGVYIDDFVLEKITGGYVHILPPGSSYDHLQWHLNNNEQLWGFEEVDVRAVDAWGIGTGSLKFDIAVIDDGVEQHSELFYRTGYDATGNGSEGLPSGNDAHGTACAGVAAAKGFELAGVTTATRILPVRVFIGGVTQDSWLADGISWAAANGADVLSNSWGGGLPSTVITNAIRDTTINGRGGLGVLSVFAAGNQNGAVSYPANLPETLAVGALSPCAERKAPTSCDGEFWWGSNFGPTLDLVAPGVNMYTIDLDNAAGYDPWDYYHDFGGTSAAAPLAAGTAALMLTVDPTLTPPELVDLLRSSADDIGAPGFDNQTGFGRLNAYEAMLASDPLRTLTIELKGTGTGIVTSDPGNINCGTICSEIYFKGTVVELTATPIGNAMFTGWSGPADCADGTVTVTTSFECTATFDLPTYQFSVSKAGSGLGTVIAGSQIHCGTTCSSIYTEGTVLELFGYPEPGSQLEGWSGHPDCEDGAVTIMAPMACTATFGPCSGESVLLVPPQVVNGIETFEACNTVQVGAGGFQVGPTGVVTLSAGNSIVLENGFEVLDGGSLSAATGVPISP